MDSGCQEDREGIRRWQILQTICRLLGTLLGASMGLKEGPIFFFAVELAHSGWLTIQSCHLSYLGHALISIIRDVSVMYILISYQLCEEDQTILLYLGI